MNNENQNFAKVNYENLRIAKIIYSQIGHKALFMLGAKNFITVFRGLSFKIGNNSKRINYIQIVLNALDLYDISFSYVTSHAIYHKAKVENVYCDQLHEVIENETGLYTHL